MSLLQKIKSLPEEPVIDPIINDRLTKLINIKRTSQWELLNLSDEEADNLYNELGKIKSQYKRHGKLIEKIEKAPHENIPILLEGEDFI